jgi:hypothetical protein
MTTKNYARSVRAKLLNISKEENVFYQSILTRYFQERLLYRLSVSPYKERFILKGGALLYAQEHVISAVRNDTTSAARNWTTFAQS